MFQSNSDRPGRLQISDNRWFKATCLPCQEINKEVTDGKADKFYRAILFICAVYFMAVAIAHQMGTKLPMLFVFYNVPSERYQDLIVSFLSFGWAMLFWIGFIDPELKPGVHVPIIISGIAAIFGLIRARMEIPSHNEITYEIIALAVLLFTIISTYVLAVMKKRET